MILKNFGAKIKILLLLTYYIVFENHRKSLIQHCERSKLRLHFEWTFVHSKCQKWSILASFWKPEACSQTLLPDRSVLMGQKLVENAKTKNSKWDILSNFQTTCIIKLPWADWISINLSWKLRLQELPIVSVDCFWLPLTYFEQIVSWL